jgi:hypothetical protein
VKVVVLVVDSLRADAPGFAGGAPTPHMDTLAAEGSRFERSWVSGSWTIPSLASMATGCFPHKVGICRWRHPFPAERPSLFQSFARAGFEVRCLGPNPRWLFRTFPGHGGAGDSQEPDQVVEALRAPRGTDRLVFIHHWWTHMPYVQKRLPRAGWRKACDLLLESMGRSPGVMAPKVRGLYRRAVKAFDDELLPRYLDAALSGGDDVLLLLTGDHGENFGESLPRGRRIEHIFDLHGRWLDDGTTCVPLLFWGKGHGGHLPEGQALGGFARGVDVAPTVCELAGLPWPEPMARPSPPTVVDRGPGWPDGLSLAPAIRAGEDAPATDALTVVTHNVFHPDTYPTSGRQTFRRFGLRTAEGRFLRDFVDGTSDASSLGGLALPEELAEPAFERLAAEHASAVDPGQPVPETWFESSGPREDVEAGDLEHRMRTLGYLD